ncbi:MAG: glycosyltransferase family 39 protein, partial [Chloroflexota bacterium]
MKRKSLTSYQYYSGLIAILLLYLGVSFYQIHLPGLHYDEAFEAVPALQLINNQTVTPFRNSAISLGPYRLPLMTQDYIGALNTYLSLPFITLLGATPTALRTMSILVGVITLWLTCLLTTHLTKNSYAGLGAALLLSVDPTFVFWNRQGIFVTAITAAIGLGAAYCLIRRFQSDTTKWWSIAGAFLLGLGLYAKFLFLWLILALAGSLLLLNLYSIFQKRGHIFSNSTEGLTIDLQFPGPLLNLTKQETVLIAISFLIGCWP